LRLATAVLAMGEFRFFLLLFPDGEDPGVELIVLQFFESFYAANISRSNTSSKHDQ
jgi:hypothetical protein